MLFFNVFFRTLGFLSALLIFVVIINILIHFSNDFQANQFSMTDGNESSSNIIAKINLGTHLEHTSMQCAKMLIQQLL